MDEEMTLDVVQAQEQDVTHGHGVEQSAEQRVSQNAVEAQQSLHAASRNLDRLLDGAARDLGKQAEPILEQAATNYQEVAQDTVSQSQDAVAELFNRIEEELKNADPGQQAGLLQLGQDAALAAQYLAEDLAAAANQVSRDVYDALANGQTQSLQAVFDQATQDNDAARIQFQESMTRVNDQLDLRQKDVGKAIEQNPNREVTDKSSDRIADNAELKKMDVQPSKQEDPSPGRLDLLNIALASDAQDNDVTRSQSYQAMMQSYDQITQQSLESAKERIVQSLKEVAEYLGQQAGQTLDQTATNYQDISQDIISQSQDTAADLFKRIEEAMKIVDPGQQEMLSKLGQEAALATQTLVENLTAAVDVYDALANGQTQDLQAVFDQVKQDNDSARTQFQESMTRVNDELAQVVTQDTVVQPQDFTAELFRLVEKELQNADPALQEMLRQLGPDATQMLAESLGAAAQVSQEVYEALANDQPQDLRAIWDQATKDSEAASNQFQEPLTGFVDQHEAVQAYGGRIVEQDRNQELTEDEGLQQFNREDLTPGRLDVLNEALTQTTPNSDAVSTHLQEAKMPIYDQQVQNQQINAEHQKPFDEKPLTDEDIDRIFDNAEPTGKGLRKFQREDLVLNIDEKKAVNEDGISEEERMQRARDLYNRQFLDSMMNQATKNNFVDSSRELTNESTEEVSVRQDPSVLFTHDWKNIIEMRDICTYVLENSVLDGKDANQVKNTINRQLREEIKNPQTESGRAVSEALRDLLGKQEGDNSFFLRKRK